MEIDDQAFKTEEASYEKSTCKRVFEISARHYQVRYPGESCDPEQHLYKCLFGTRRCLNKRCIGFSSAEKCRDTRDCNPMFYCEEGICQLQKKAEETCIKHIQCGRDMLCHKGGPGSYNKEEYGICKNFFSLEDGVSKNTELIKPTENDSIWNLFFFSFLHF